AEMIVTRPDGQRRPILVSATPVRGVREEVAGAVFVLEDLSTQKELDRLRAEFAAIVAHDLRNPISAILMNAELVLERAAGHAEGGRYGNPPRTGSAARRPAWAPWWRRYSTRRGSISAACRSIRGRSTSPRW